MQISSSLRHFATVAAVLATSPLPATAEPYGNSTRYSTWMASSLISRRDGIMTGKGGSSEPLQAGFTQKAFKALLAQYPHNDIHAQNYLQASVDSVVPYLSNATEDALSYPLDRLSNGNAMISSLTGAQRSPRNETASYELAVDALRQSIDLNRRTDEGGLWYYTYPNWSYLDGMYSLAPFYTLYTVSHSGSNGTLINQTALDDMALQVDLLWQHCLNASSGLLSHGYDASLTAVWADPITGASPHVWGRSLGWYVMALVDTLEILPRLTSTSETIEAFIKKFRTLASAVIQAVDPVTGGWWQVMDMPGREGNYIESSGSAMFTYALFKGHRLGYLNDNVTATAPVVARRAYEYLTDAFIVRNTNGTLGYNGTVSVCSLNSNASYKYYVGQPIKYNSVLGSAAYILASLEFERLESKHTGLKSRTRGYLSG
ncbi:hypothetical protein VMCG_10395 [Cytospora schulzeri]|uniref:Uncharacterized protein n=1 Tax=Cytospora schulzeri TaxID=448051 RepID=A0A423VB03_9PEZI|nr:hypothetical protein VMCG_10395 [Valsa malicola]